MSERLFAVEPALTPRQQEVLDVLRRLGAAGLSADEAGAIAHELKRTRNAHSRSERCLFCGSDGLAVLRRLRDLGLARYRSRLRVWQAVGSESGGALPRGMSDDIGF